MLALVRCKFFKVTVTKLRLSVIAVVSAYYCIKLHFFRLRVRDLHEMSTNDGMSVVFQISNLFYRSATIRLQLFCWLLSTQFDDWLQPAWVFRPNEIRKLELTLLFLVQTISSLHSLHHHLFSSCQQERPAFSPTLFCAAATVAF